MRYDLLDKLSCPSCKSSAFRCIEFKRGDQAGSVEDGLLTCSCGEGYSVIRGVPRLLPADLRHLVYQDYRWFFRQYADLLKDQIPGSTLGTNSLGSRECSDLSKTRTAESFGYEWNQFSSMVSHYEKNFQHYFEGFPTDFFQGKKVLDVGCGMGRHSYYAAMNGAAVTGLDLSSAIDAAHRNNRGHKNSQFIQADLYNIPLKPEQFDLVYCLGVLHHLPNPEAGFRSLLKYVKPGGVVHIYVYHKLEAVAFGHKALLSIVSAVRHLTTRMPHLALKRMTFAMASLFYLGLIIPASLLKKVPKLHSCANLVPLHRYAGLPFNAIYKDTFDRFSAPIEHRYGREEVIKWFINAGLTNIHVMGGSGWRVSGKKRHTSSEAQKTGAACAESVAN